MHNPKSNCCNAPIRISSGDEGTSFYICSKCNKACDAGGMYRALSLPPTDGAKKSNKTTTLGDRSGEVEDVTNIDEEVGNSNKELSWNCLADEKNSGKPGDWFQYSAASAKTQFKRIQQALSAKDSLITKKEAELTELRQSPAYCDPELNRKLEALTKENSKLLKSMGVWEVVEDLKKENSELQEEKKLWSHTAQFRRVELLQEELSSLTKKIGKLEEEIKSLEQIKRNYLHDNQALQAEVGRLKDALGKEGNMLNEIMELHEKNKELQSLRSENERLKVDPQERPMLLKEIQELTALCTVQAEALNGVCRFAKIPEGLSAPLYEIINTDELYNAWCAIKPLSTKLLKQQEIMREALRDIEIHSGAPFAKVDPRTDNWKWLNYVREVAHKALNTEKKRE